MSILKDLISSAKKRGSKMIIIEVPEDKNPKLVTSEEFKDLPNMFGKAIGASVKAWVASSSGQLTDEKAMHAFMFAVTETARKTLGEIKLVEKHGAEEEQLVELVKNSS